MKLIARDSVLAHIKKTDFTEIRLYSYKKDRMIRVVANAHAGAIASASTLKEAGSSGKPHAGTPRFLLCEDGFERAEFPFEERRELIKALQKCIKREFPRSHKIYYTEKRP